MSEIKHLLAQVNPDFHMKVKVAAAREGLTVRRAIIEGLEMRLNIRNDKVREGEEEETEATTAEVE